MRDEFNTVRELLRPFHVPFVTQYSSVETTDGQQRLIVASLDPLDHIVAAVEMGTDGGARLVPLIED